MELSVDTMIEQKCLIYKFEVDLVDLQNANTVLEDYEYFDLCLSSNTCISDKLLVLSTLAARIEKLQHFE